MKKLFLSLIIMVFAAQLSAQSLAFKYEGETVEPGTIDIVTNDIIASPEVIFDLHIINTTDADINVVWEMNDTVNGEKIGINYVCFGACYGPNVITKSHTLAAGSEEMFQGHCAFANNEGLLPAGTVINVVYTFFDERNPEEKYVFNVNFKYEGIVCDAPQNLKVVVTKDDPNYNKKYKITLTWDAIEGAEGYIVYAATQYYPDGVYMGSVTTNEFINGSNVEGDICFFVTSICNMNSSICSGPSERVCVFVGETEFDVVTSINIEKAGQLEGAGKYSYGETITLKAIPNVGYKFLNWTENGEVVSEESEYSFIAKYGRELIANFELLSYNVSALLNLEYTGYIKGDGVYFHGDTVTLTATPAYGYTFLNWTENGEVVSDESEYSFVLTSDRNLVANCAFGYNVTLISINPEAGDVIGYGDYVANDVVTVKATANAGYTFVNWTENGKVVSEEAEYTFTITKDRILVANFIQTSVTYNVTATVNPEKVGVVMGKGIYSHGDNVTLVAIPVKTGYEFVNWTEDGVVVSEDVEYSFVATSDRDLIANFVLLDYYVSAVANAAEAGEITGSGNYNHGEDVTLTAVANEGYKFVN